MTALLYFLIGVLAGGLSVRAWLVERKEAARVAFLGLGVCVGIAYGAFALSLLPGLAPLRGIYMMAGTFVPAFALWTVDRLFGRPDAQRASPWVQTLFLATLLVAPTTAGAHLLFYDDPARPSPPSMVGGAFAFIGLGLVLLRLGEALRATPLQVERARLRYLLVIAGGAAVFTLVEHLFRLFFPPIDPAGLSLASRGVVLQGPLPPISVLLTALALYFLYQTLVMSRLLDLHEMFSHFAALALSAFLLVIVDGITVMWFGTFMDYPFHSTFQIFLGSLLFLAAYDPLKAQIEWGTNRLFNQRGQRLQDVIATLRAEVPTVIATRDLSDRILSRLHASGRVPACSMYLFDRGIDAFALVGERGQPAKRPLAAVAAHPFTDGFADQPWYLRATLNRRARTDEGVVEIIALLDAMNAELCIPLVSRGGVVLGWLNLRDEEWSDGFSADEILRMAEVVDVASTVLSNIQDFQALEEEHRLAALGAMAAGLAHEIRNPLAGIKGAAQYLQAEALAPDAQEMLDVVIQEADRLNVVVSQFLDYARPFDLVRTPDHVNAIVTHVLALVRAQGIPAGVQVVERLSGDIPAMPMDRPRLSQVLLNLVQNALQAMPQGGTLTVATRSTTSRSGLPMVEVAVSDTGVGIAADDLEKLFIPFFTTKKDGTGLGLAICHRIVQAHGGELDVQSTKGRGATFLVRIPVPRQAVAEDELDKSAAK